MIPTTENLISNQIFKISKSNETFKEFMEDCKAPNTIVNSFDMWIDNY